MSTPPLVLATSGSLRSASYNRQLLRLGVAAVEAAGARVEPLDLRLLALPIYDGDLEQAEGLPAGAKLLKERLAAAQGWLIASPEYNHSIPGGLKNAIDWIHRPPSNPIAGKVALLMGASSGPGGTIRLNYHLKQSLQSLGMWVVPGYLGVANAAGAFDEAGQLKDPTLQKIMTTLAQQFVSKLPPGA